MSINIYLYTYLYDCRHHRVEDQDRVFMTMSSSLRLVASGSQWHLAVVQGQFSHAPGVICLGGRNISLIMMSSDIDWARRSVLKAESQIIQVSNPLRKLELYPIGQVSYVVVVSDTLLYKTCKGFAI